MIYLHPSEVRWIYKNQFPMWYAYLEALHNINQNVQGHIWGRCRS